jgi:glutaredoxin
MPPEKESIGKKATIHRMVLPEHTCPYGKKAKELLEKAGYEVEDKQLMSREQTDAFKKEQGVETTPLIFIEGEKIGGCDELKKRLAS